MSLAGFEVCLLSRNVVRIAVFLLLVSAAQAQNSAGCRQQSVIVSVHDQQDKPVADLQPASFRGTAGGSALKVLSARAGTSAPRIVLVLDQSGSVNRKFHTFETATTLAGNFVSSNAGKARIAAVFFSDHVIDTVGFEAPPNDILRKLRDRQDGKGRTTLYDSLIYGANLFRTPQPGDAVYAITDGGDNSSKSDPRDVEREFLSRRVRLFSFILPIGPFNSPKDQMGQSELLDLVEVTGGTVGEIGAFPFPPAKGSKELNGALQRLYEAMTQFYRLEIQVPDLKKQSRWKLEVVDGNGKKRRDVEVNYPRRLASCQGTRP